MYTITNRDGLAKEVDNVHAVVIRTIAQIKESQAKAALASISAIGDINYQADLKSIKKKVFIQTHDLNEGPFWIVVIADEKTRANIILTSYNHSGLELITMRFTYPEGVKAIVKKFIHNLFMEGFEVGILDKETYSPWSPEIIEEDYDS